MITKAVWLPTLAACQERPHLFGGEEIESAIYLHDQIPMPRASGKWARSYQRCLCTLTRKNARRRRASVGYRSPRVPRLKLRACGPATDSNRARFITSAGTSCQNAPMPSPDTASSPLNRNDQPSIQDPNKNGRQSSRQEPEPANRFGAAASIIDLLDLRPLHIRQRRPWWRLW